MSETLAAVQIHWFSIFNSFMMVIFLTGLVSMILLRTLRADYARYTAVSQLLPRRALSMAGCRGRGSPGAGCATACMPEPFGTAQ